MFAPQNNRDKCCSSNYVVTLRHVLSHSLFQPPFSCSIFIFFLLNLRLHLCLSSSRLFSIHFSYIFLTISYFVSRVQTLQRTFDRCQGLSQPHSSILFLCIFSSFFALLHILYVCKVDRY